MKSELHERVLRILKGMRFETRIDVICLGAALRNPLIEKPFALADALSYGYVGPDVDKGDYDAVMEWLSEDDK